ncbi:MAG TPA: PQQ-binding-like beta-propeller repeat protein [Planctomycetota bacterium]|nr:PQQ-binding-like beta-propeller repeat protein [Planctomycetota bacterium]
MKTTIWLALAAFLCAAQPAPDAPVLVEQILSREHPDFSVDAPLTVGRDGRVYLASGGNHSYVLRYERDGGGKKGGPVTYACANATANAQGTIATASGHFAHKVTLYDRDFQEFAHVDDFLVNDQVGWDAPAHVEAGAGGDFYAIDQHRDRIVRITPSGKIVTSYPVPHEPDGGQGLVEDFRVWEQGQTFYVLNRAGQIRSLGFDGKKKWSLNPGVGHRSGGFDVDDSGVLYAIHRDADLVRKLGPDGAPAGEIKLALNDRKPGAREHGFTELRIHEGAAILKRRHPVELFERYDLASGTPGLVVRIDHERLAIRFPRAIWSAGEKLPFTIDFNPGGRRVQPSWRVWLRPLHSTEYQEALVKDGTLQVPSTLIGLVQLKVTPELSPIEKGRASDYLVRTVVDIRRPGETAPVAVLVSENRTHFARGEDIPFTITGSEARGEVRLMDGERPVATLAAEAGRVPGDLTRTLRPGVYHLAFAGDGITAVPATIVLGPGRNPTAFPSIQYGDYGSTYPHADPETLPDVVESHTARLERLGINVAVDRIGSNTQIGDLSWSGRSAGELDALAKRFPSLAASVKPASPLRSVMGAYSARGIQEMAILMYMDAGLPLGAPGFDNRKPDELIQAITRVTTALSPYPSFRGWSWASNWWVFEGRGSKAARGPEQKTAYEAALKKARETGAWDPVLDEVADRRLNWAVEAQDLFNRTSRTVKPGLVTAVAGPYRNVEAYPPITFSNVDEIDLQAQWEQIALPYHAPHSVDFYRRPGKRAWVHPEAWNDAGTGDQLIPTLLSALQRGAQGIGISGAMSPWMTGVDGLPHDSRSAHYGTVSVYRALTDLVHQYGPWWTSLETRDPVAIVADGRMLKIDDWLGQGVTGKYFARVYEAWCACQHAHLPATHVFAEDVTAESLKRFKAILLVGQQVDLEPRLLDALKGSGVPVFHDGTCRDEVVHGFAPLGVAFDHVEKDSHPASDDAAYWRFPRYFHATAPALRQALAAVVPPAFVENEEVHGSERASEEGRYLFLVNHTTPPIEPGRLWRQTLCVATRVPVVAPVSIVGPHVYDAFAMRKVEGPILADFHQLPARIYAVLPSAIASLELRSSPLTPGHTVDWTAKVVDDRGRPIRAAIPLRVRLRDASGILEEWSGSAGSAGAQGSFVVPTNSAVPTLEAVELLSGKAAGSVPPSPIESRFGPHLRDIAIAAGGSIAVMNAMNWDHNLYAVEVESGTLRWRRRIGESFAFAPASIRGGIAVQGFHADTAEGYQLHLTDAEGRTERRFALYGLPGRLPHRFVPGIQKDRINHFAVPESGAWIASSGDLGVAVWSRDGSLLWSLDRWKSRRAAGLVAALDDATLLDLEGLKARALDASTGKVLWECPLAPAGEATEIRVSRDGKTVAILSPGDGGKVFILRGGQLVATHITGGGNDFDLSGDGSLVALATGNLLKVYSAADGLRFSYSGDDFLRFPRISPDARRIVACSDLGTLTVLDPSGSILLERDLGSVAAPAWLPGGDLLLASWMGSVTRLDGRFHQRWTTLLRAESPEGNPLPPPEDHTPLVRMTSWVNSDPMPAPLTPNLLSEKDVLIKMAAQQNHIQFVRPTAMLVDGKADAAPEPWLHWGDVGSFAETSPFNSILIDTFRSRLRVTGVTLAEDPAHPESWLRDLRFEAWDPAGEQWIFVQELRSDAPIHTHRFALPVEAARFRLVLPWGVCGNLRLTEIVFHGEKLGGSHPDVVAKKPVAVLFDEGDDLKGSLVNAPLTFKFEGAYCGGRCLSLAANGKVAAVYQPPFGHVLPNWDFEIVEKPQPGQYRWLQFSWKAASPEARGITLCLWGANYGERALFYAGDAMKEEGSIPRKLGDRPPPAWETVRVDLWDFYKKPVRIRSMSLGCVGGSAAFDQILLSREATDLPDRR